MHDLKKLVTATLPIMILSVGLVACSAEVNKDPDTGAYSITIWGDDGQVVQAGSLEEALKKAKDALKKAQDENHAVGIKDWKKVIANLIEQKEAAGEEVPDSTGN